MTFRYLSTKTYGPERGLSCAFRQWRAQDSHCRFLHGYALGVKFTFGADELDPRGWVVDFGGLKNLLALLETTLDHTTLVAQDDPHLELFVDLNRLSVIRMVAVPHAGCEALAVLIFGVTEQWLKDAGFSPRCQLVSVEVFEHSANSAIATTSDFIKEQTK
jgi:6-pyruvoyltetrahydropterin/6-carboxytetrahydropterin synthase